MQVDIISFGIMTEMDSSFIIIPSDRKHVYITSNAEVVPLTWTRRQPIFYDQDRGKSSLRNVDTCLSNYAGSHSRKIIFTVTAMKTSDLKASVKFLWHSSTQNVKIIDALILHVLPYGRLSLLTLFRKWNRLLLRTLVLVTEHRTTLKSVLPVKPISTKSTFSVWGPNVQTVIFVKCHLCSFI